MKTTDLISQFSKGKLQVAETPDCKDNMYKISTGSLRFNTLTEGGLGSGIHRFTGAFESGKTSSALEVANNFLDHFGEKGRVLFLKAEMRLSFDIQDRSRRPFEVMRPSKEAEALENWSHENILVFTQNLYPDVANFVISILDSLEDDEKICIILDSVDWLKMPSDLQNFLDNKSNQVASVAKYTKEFLRHLSPVLSDGGHMFIPISQVSTNITLNKYEGHEQKASVTSGGNALLHAADWIFQFKPKTKSQLIVGKEGPVDPDKNPVLGNNARILVVKSPNETTGYSVEYPVKKGRGVWVEKEVLDTLISFGAIEQKGSWFKTSEKLLKSIKSKFDKDMPENIQGKTSLTEFFESNPDVTKFCFDKIVEGIASNKLSKDSLLERISEEEHEEIAEMIEEAKKELILDDEDVKVKKKGK